MRCFNSLSTILVCLFIIMAAGCAPSSIPFPPKPSIKGSWGSAGLHGIFINNLKQFNESLYVATDKGLYKTSLEAKITSWKSLGLKDKKVSDVAFLSGNKLLAATLSAVPYLFLSDDQGKSWQPYMNNFGGTRRKYKIVFSLSAIPKGSDTLFAKSNASIVARSTNGGKSWKAVLDQWNSWGGLGTFVKMDPYHKGTIWAGGVSALSLPILLKSINYGETWKGFNTLDVEAVCRGVVVSPQNNKAILTSFSGGSLEADQIRKSTDGGKTWHTVLDSIYTLTLAHSVRNLLTIYASGEKPKPSNLFFVASPDFGNTWKMVVWKDSPPIKVNDMVSVMQNGHEVLYFGTNKGVYSYTFEK